MTLRDLVRAVEECCPCRDPDQPTSLPCRMVGGLCSCQTPAGFECRWAGHASLRALVGAWHVPGCECGRTGLPEADTATDAADPRCLRVRAEAFL